jgi:SAM-dependent methyltransferase
MANWDDGYVTDVPYVTGFHSGTTPAWIATMATLLGGAAPDLSRPFRYADFGCGYGATALIVAATMPHAEVWAFDFNPAHVESGRDIARRAGLTNIRFEEASFDELAGMPPEALPAFDYVVSHGVLSWVSPENRRRLFNVIGQRVAPGGIVYASYNVATGWDGMPPVRTLMRLLTEASPHRGDRVTGPIFALLDRMKDAGAAMFRNHITLSNRLAEVRSQDPNYLAHELLNRDWHRLMFPAVAAAMAAIKCGYIGSASPRDNFVSLTVPAALHGLFADIRDIGLREVVRDIACATNFRRDLYQRGARRISVAEQAATVAAIRVVRTFESLPDPIVVRSSHGPFSIDQRFGQALLAALGTEPRAIGELYRDPALAEWPRSMLVEVVTLLLGDNYLAPVLSEPPGAAAIEASSRLNAVHAALFDQGYDRPYLVCPALGSAWQADPRELLALDKLRRGHIADADALGATVAARFSAAGRQLLQDGQPVTDPAALREAALGKVRDLLDHRLPVLRRLGVVDAPAEAVENAAAGFDTGDTIPVPRS